MHPLHEAPSLEPGQDAALCARIEDAALNASAPPVQRWLDGWLLRSWPGKARRSRCIHALGPGVLTLQERLARTQAVYRADGVPMVFRITPFTHPAGLAAELGARGWVAVDPTLVMAAPLTAGLGAPEAKPGLRLRAVAPEEFAEAVGALRGSPPEHRRSQARRLAQAPTPHQAWLVEHRHDGHVLACGQSAREAERVGLYDIATAPAARQQGLARHLCQWLLAQAAAEGATTAYLQVDAQNTPALALYRSLGFALAYRYHYLEAPHAA